MRNILTYLIVLFCSFSSFGQNGFMGNAYEIEVSALANMPLLSGSFKETNYFKKSDQMQGRRDFLDYGAEFRISKNLSAYKSIGIDVIGKRLELFADRVFEQSFKNQILGEYIRTTNIHIEGAQVQMLSIIPVITIASKGSYIGDGLVHDFGIGYSRVTIRNKGYYYSLNEFETMDEDAWTPTDLYFLDVDWPPYHGVTAKYGLSLQIPLTNNVSIKFGAVSLLNFYYRPKFDIDNPLKSDFFNHDDLLFNLRRENLFSLNVKTGVVISL